MSCLYNVNGSNCAAKFNRCAVCPNISKPEPPNMLAKPKPEQELGSFNKAGEGDKEKNKALMKTGVAAGLSLVIIFGVSNLLEDDKRNFSQKPPEHSAPPNGNNKNVTSIDSGLSLQNIIENIQIARPDTPSAPLALPAPKSISNIETRMIIEESEFFRGINAGGDRHTRLDENIDVYYRGEQMNGVSHGNGRLWFRDSTRNFPDATKYFFGYFDAGMINGFGRLTFADGPFDYIEGIFSGYANKIKLEGDVKVRFKTGEVFIGHMEDDIINEGSCYSSNGQIKAIPLVGEANQIPDCRQ